MKKVITTLLLLVVFCSVVWADMPEMVLVEGGTFSMGSHDGDDEEQPVHDVTVGSFYIGRYEITNQEVVDVFTRGIESETLFVDSRVVLNI